jgi:plasmid stabilization system protein ParE
MRIRVLDQATADLIEGFHFYEHQQVGLGSYFLASLHADIESLRLYGGVHRVAYRGYHRLLSKRFPFAVFYKVHADTVFVYAVVDCRRDPAWIRRHLK